MSFDITYNAAGEPLPWEMDLGYWEMDLVKDGSVTPNRLKELHERREKSLDEAAQLENEARRKVISDSISDTRKCAGTDCPNPLMGDSGFCSDACRDNYWGKAKHLFKHYSLKEMQAKVIEWAKERRLAVQNVNRETTPAIA